MIGADARGGQVKRCALFFRYLGGQSIDLACGEPQIVLAQRHSIVAFRQFDQGIVTTMPDLVDNSCDGGIHIRTVLALGGQQRGERPLEIGHVSAQKVRHVSGSFAGSAYALPPGASRYGFVTHVGRLWFSDV